MASTFGIFEAAKSGLNVSMENLKVTGHNIANANTVGYTRQRLITSAKEAGNSVCLIRPTRDNMVGQGVEVIDIQQIRSEYLDNQYRDLNAGYHRSEFTAQSFTYLEGLFNSELKKGEGLTGSIEEFFGALNTFTSDTTSKENRIAVQKTALGLTQNFNLVYEEMKALWIDQNDSISTVAQQINSLAVKLSELNEAIARYERRGETANDLRDERNLLLDELSGYVNMTYCNSSTNSSMVDVQIGGVDLVVGTAANTIGIDCAADHIDALTAQMAEINGDIEDAVGMGGSATAEQLTALSDLAAELNTYIAVTSSTNASGGTDVTCQGASLVSGSSTTAVSKALENDLDAWMQVNSNTLTLNATPLSIASGTITGGKLYAHMEQISSNHSDHPGIPYYMGQLNELARSIARNINDIHLTGYSYDTDTSVANTTSENGLYFFHVETDVDIGGTVTAEHYSRITAGNFSISNDIADNVWNIAGSSEQVHSDGTTMASGNAEVALLMYGDLAGSGYYSELNGIVGHLAIALDTNQSLLDTGASLLNSVDTQRASISGVSRDEEAANLIIYQQSYNACARMVTTIDEMLETMISRMGLVGR